MSKKSDDHSVGQKPLRLWPGVVTAILLLIVKYGVPMVMPDALAVNMFGGVLMGLIILLWWVFFSRARRLDRLLGAGLMIAALFFVRPFLHMSIAEAGMGALFFILAFPMLTVGFVIWVLVSQPFSLAIRRVSMIATILFLAGFWTLVRTAGINNDAQSDFAWRWTPTPEEQLLTRADDEIAVFPVNTDTLDLSTSWCGFRGPRRDGIVRATQINTDWGSSPPTELWRQPVGPGWSSFAVLGELFYTQEQRGQDEVVSCYYLSSGEPVWIHTDSTRFWESNSGAGPRATPMLHDERVYTLGATGILNVLDAVDGRIIWSRNAAVDAKTEVPIWGFSGSPLIVDGQVIVALAGSLVSYDLGAGDLQWSVYGGGDCYSSPHLVTIEGVRQVVLQNEFGLSSISPVNGTVLWQHEWPGHPIVQPAWTGANDLFLSVDDRSGMCRISVSQKMGQWVVTEHWRSKRIKPYFNDSVIHKGHVYGFDGRSLACIDIADGERQWKGGRYGRGQMILLADQDLLLVLSEKGDLALAQAIAGQFTELCRVPAITGKTWNHPVLTNNILLVRNAKEMAAFRL